MENINKCIYGLDLNEKLNTKKRVYIYYKVISFIIIHLYLVAYLYYIININFKRYYKNQTNCGIDIFNIYFFQLLAMFLSKKKTIEL